VNKPRVSPEPADPDDEGHVVDEGDYHPAWKAD
jgi:hypothetical protein